MTPLIDLAKHVSPSINMSIFVGLILFNHLSCLFVPIDGFKKFSIMFYGPGFNPNTGFQDGFCAEEARAEAENKADHPESGSEDTGPETVFVELDLEILEVSHLVAHCGDKLAVKFGRFFGELEFVDVGGHSFEGVKGLKGFFESFQLL